MSGGFSGGGSGITREQLAPVLMEIVVNFENRFSNMEKLLRTILERLEKIDDRDGKIGEIISLMNERDKNREPMNERLDKLSRWYVPSKEDSN